MNWVRPRCTGWGGCLGGKNLGGPPKNPRYLMSDMKQFPWNLTPRIFVPMQ